MPRPRKCRRVCCMPSTLEFIPIGHGPFSETVTLTVDEYEAIRLIDDEGLSQEECGQSMNIARTTVQQIYTLARKKLARALVNGYPLKIEGGDYQLCEDGEHRGCMGCRRRGCAKGRAEEKGGNKMKAAIPVFEDQTSVCVSFGRAPYFLFCDLETGAVEVKENPAAQAEGGAGVKSAQFVADEGADAVITVRCGENAGELFKAAEIAVYKSEGESAMENIEALKAGKLSPLTHFHAGFHGLK